jgi:hypothetical protein
MRACPRVALASIAVCASFSLSGCAAIEELKETFLRWVESQKLPHERSVSAGELPEATPVVLAEKAPVVSNAGYNSSSRIVNHGFAPIPSG